MRLHMQLPRDTPHPTRTWTTRDEKTGQLICVQDGEGGISVVVLDPQPAQNITINLGAERTESLIKKHISKAIEDATKALAGHRPSQK